MAIKKIKCVDCGNDFDFDEGEQAFFKEKGFRDPIRCKNCRNNRKAKQEGKNARN